MTGQTPELPFSSEEYAARLARVRCGMETAGLEVLLTTVPENRVYLTPDADFEQVGRAHGEFFKDIRPATSMVEVSRLIGPEILVEIEADAVVSS